jgi:DNA-binding NarL/FixJ family response regulator
MHHDAIYAVRAFKIGVSGFVLKNSASLELLSAVKAVLNGQTYVSAQMSEQLAAYAQGVAKSWMIRGV